MRVTKLEVSLDAFYHNVQLLRELVPNKEIMPVFKANAYGTYLQTKLEVLNQFKIVAVALTQEGVEIRKLGYKGDIFLLNQPSIEELDDICKYHLTVGLSDFSFLKECISKEVKIPVHLEIETGMNRTGILLDDLNRFIDLLNKSSLEVKGIYSHFSSADYDMNYTNQQIELFKESISVCKSRGFTFDYIHISASSGILKCSLDFTNLVRPGILLYGYEAFKGSFKRFDFKPVCRLISEVSFVKRVPEGSKIGYSQTYTCDQDSLIATIPIGYADGYRRELSNKGYVFINGKKAPIIGKICMDSFMVDVTGIRVQTGDKVVLFDSNHITLDEIAEMCNTISYELLCTISDRVPRIFIS